MTTKFSDLSDEMLLQATKRAASDERTATVELITLLIEVERRGLRLGLGHSSLFVYCTRALRLSEQAAYSRITAARTARRFPNILAALNNGALTLSSVGLLSPHLNDENAEALLAAASHKSTREVERLIAAWNPQPDVPTTVRRLPSEPTGQTHHSPNTPLLAGPSEGSGPGVTELPSQRAPVRVALARPVTITAPIAPSRYLLKLTISEDTHDKLTRARALLRHAIPNGDADQIINRGLTLLLDDIVRRRFAETRKPRRASGQAPKGRGIPASVRREVWRRDGGRCAFQGEHGLCGETAFLEYHHVVPFAAGGRSDVGNLQLRCRAHNGYEAMMYYGSEALENRR